MSITELSEIYDVLRTKLFFRSKRSDWVKQRQDLSRIHSDNWEVKKTSGENRSRIANDLREFHDQKGIDVCLSVRFEADFSSFSAGTLGNKKCLAIISWYISRDRNIALSVFRIFDAYKNHTDNQIAEIFGWADFEQHENSQGLSEIPDEEDWLGKGYVWELKQHRTKRFDGQVASFTLKPEQFTVTTSPINTGPEIYLQGISEPESGFKIGFRVAEVSADLGGRNQLAEFKMRYGDVEEENWENATLKIVSREDFELLRIISKDGFLEGNYILKNNTAFAYLPKTKHSKFTAKLTVDADRDNLVCPPGKEMNNDAKKEIITRMILNEQLPRLKKGRFVLQETTYIVEAKLRDELL